MKFISKSFYSVMTEKLNVQRSLSLLQYQGYKMNVPIEKQQLFTPEQTINDRLVKAFFTQYNNHINVYHHADSTKRDKETNNPRNSWYKVVIPLSTNPELNFKFKKSSSNQVRTGRLLEIMDYVASTVSYRYIETGEATIATAFVDHINFFNQVASDQDLIIQGYVNYVGTSSIEVQIDVFQEVQGKEQLTVSAIFLMVGRQKGNHAVPFKAPPLDLTQEDQTAQLRFQIGQKNQECRKQSSSRSLYKQPPTQIEITKLHEFFMKDQTTDMIQINDTILEKNLLMHVQDRNLHGKIFGGHIMREAFELGWLCAYLHGKGVNYPEIFHIDDVQFIAPVEVGCTLSIKSRVTYVQDNVLHAQVECSKILPDTTRIRTNDLHLTFNINGGEIRKVYPKTYQEGMMWLDAKRKLDLIS